MTTKLTISAKRANTLSAIRENFDLYPADLHRAVCEPKRLAGYIDDLIDAYVESEPEYYAGLPAAMHLAIAKEAVERFAVVEA
jgi:hypothetical protein